MKFLKLGILLSLVLSVAGCSDNTSTKSKSDKIEPNSPISKEEVSFELKDSFVEGVVSEIVDGDTIYVELPVSGEPSGKELYLEGINAPEISV